MTNIFACGDFDPCPRSLVIGLIYDYSEGFVTGPNRWVSSRKVNAPKRRAKFVPQGRRRASCGYGGSGAGTKPLYGSDAVETVT